MPVPIITIAALIGRIYPILRAVIKATKRKSRGGKAITPEERVEIIAVALGGFADVLEEVIPGVEG